MTDRQLRIFRSPSHGRHDVLYGRWEVYCRVCETNCDRGAYTLGLERDEAFRLAGEHLRSPEHQQALMEAM